MGTPPGIHPPLAWSPPGGASQSCPRVAEEESKLGLTLPPSFREWIRFADEPMARRTFGILRDRYEVTRLKDHPAISLMLQGRPIAIGR